MGLHYLVQSNGEAFLVIKTVPNLEAEDHMKGVGEHEQGPIQMPGEKKPVHSTVTKDPR